MSSSDNEKAVDKPEEEEAVAIIEEDQFLLVFGEDPEDSNANDLIVYLYDPVSGETRTNGKIKYRKYAKFLFSESIRTMIIGGDQYGDGLNTTDRFNAKTKCITKLAPMKCARSGTGAALLNSDIVVCGGNDGGNPLDSCEIYIWAEDRWCSLPSMSTARSLPGVACLAERRVLVIGGWGNIEGARTRFSSVEMCQIPDDIAENPSDEANFWKDMASMQEKRNDPSVAILDGKIFVTGGHDGQSFLTSSEMFLPPDEKIPLGQWIGLASITNTVRIFCVIAAQNRLYAFGAKEYPGDTILRYEPQKSEKAGSEYEDDAKFKDFVSWKWIPLSPMPKLDYIHGVSKVSKSLLNVENNST